MIIGGHMRFVRPFFAVAGAALVAASLVTTPARVLAQSAVFDKDGLVPLQIIGMNDFHGNLEPPAGSSGRVGSVDAGGAEYLATHLATARQGKPYSVTVAAGDLIGASPLLSGLFHDEPAIESLMDMGLDIAAVGNHEFDEGADELLRIQKGGCHPKDGCKVRPYGGATFEYLSTNVVDKKTKKTLLSPSTVRTYGGVRVAFLGLTLKDTPTIVSPGGVASLDFLEESEAINAEVKRLKSQWSNLNAFVVLIHEGGLPTGGINECPGISGPISGIVKKITKDVDLVISGHTHAAYVCNIEGIPVSSSLAFSRLYADIDTRLSPTTNDFASIKIQNKIVTRDVAKNATQTNSINRWKAAAAPLANRVVGSIPADVTRTANPSGESAAGDLIADSQLFVTKEKKDGGAVIAFMNPGGIRTDFVFKQSSGGEKDGEVTFGEAFSVQPFGNNLMTMTLTGADIKEVLEQQFDNPTAGASRILQVSEGFAFTYDRSFAKGSRILTITLGGKAIDPAAKYRVTANNFLADGGDLFSAFTKGTERLGGVVDTDALEAYLLSPESKKDSVGKVAGRITGK
jgi:5'-nucleotidase